MCRLHRGGHSLVEDRLWQRSGRVWLLASMLAYPAHKLHAIDCLPLRAAIWTIRLCNRRQPDSKELRLRQHIIASTGARTASASSAAPLRAGLPTLITGDFSGTQRFCCIQSAAVRLLCTGNHPALRSTSIMLVQRFCRPSAQHGRRCSACLRPVSLNLCWSTLARNPCARALIKRCWQGQIDLCFRSQLSL